MAGKTLIRSFYTYRKVLGFLALFPLAGCQWVQNWWNPTTETEEESLPWPAHAIDYNVNFTGDFPDNLQSPLREVSALVTLKEKQPLISQVALRRRMNADLKNLDSLLKAKGYLDATIDGDITGEESPFKVNLIITAGERYHITGITFHNTRADSAIQAQPSDVFHRVKIDDPMDSQSILTIQQSLTLYLQENGYPGSQVKEPRIEVNRIKKTVNVHVYYNPGQLSDFGTHEIIGLENLDPTYVSNRLAWKEGQTYDRRLVEETRRKLMSSAIFDSITIKPKDSNVTPTPMLIQTTEAPPRVFGAGLRYFSSEGLGAKLFWRHYNALGGGELIDTSLQLSQLLTQLRLGMGFPDVLAPEQQLQTLLTITPRENTKAYFAKTVEAEVKIQRPLMKAIVGSIGVLYEGGQVRRASQQIHERLIGLPLEASIDTADNPLDPHSGWRSRLTFVPYGGRVVDEKSMYITRFQARGYIPFGSKVDPVVLAVWTNLGSISIKNPNNVPFNKRFYAGGGGSVRAYGYQRLGPIDSDGLPLGGRSIAEGGIEGRFRLTETWGGVVFFEGGAVSNNRSPLLRAQFLWGPGAGVRYYTPIGPLRLDIAVPLKRRKVPGQKSFDSPFQFYISIGQAF